MYNIDAYYVPPVCANNSKGALNTPVQFCSIVKIVVGWRESWLGTPTRKALPVGGWSCQQRRPPPASSTGTAAAARAG
eukprot:5187524-Pyramimonas_sp.AAC.1